MGFYQKFVEWGTDAKWLADGVICESSLKKLNVLVDYRSSWIPNTLRKTDPFRAIYSRTRFC